jgi:hypothetical protein
MKTCRKCGEEKPFNEFPRNTRVRDGLSSWCRACHREASRVARLKNQKRYNAARRVVPAFVWDPLVKRRVANPSGRPKSRVY